MGVTLQNILVGNKKTKQTPWFGEILGCSDLGWTWNCWHYFPGTGGTNILPEQGDRRSMQVTAPHPAEKKLISKATFPYKVNQLLAKIHTTHCQSNEHAT